MTVIMLLVYEMDSGSSGKTTSACVSKSGTGNGQELDVAAGGRDRQWSRSQSGNLS